MRIDIRQIQNAKPYRVGFELDPAMLNPSCAHHPSSFHIFKRPVACQAVLRRSEEDIWIQARARVNTTPCCDRCLEDFEQIMPFEKVWTCVPHQVEEEATQELHTCGEGHEESVYAYVPPILQLDAIFREQILLDLPMRFLCSESCQGLCDGCGANMNLQAHAQRCEKGAIFQQKVENL